MFSLALASASFEIRDMWHPAIWLIWFFIALGLLPSFKAFISRLFVVGIIWGGATAMWFIANPTPTHVSYPEYEFLAPLISIVLPISVAISLISWREGNSQSTPPAPWGWIIFISGFVWMNTYFGGTKNQVLANVWKTIFHAMRLSPLTVIELQTNIALVGRSLYFAIFVAAVWSLANRSQATRVGRIIFSIGSCAILAIFEHLRYHETYWKAPNMSIYVLPAIIVIIAVALLELALAPQIYEFPEDLKLRIQKQSFRDHQDTIKNQS